MKAVDIALTATESTWYFRWAAVLAASVPLLSAGQFDQVLETCTAYSALPLLTQAVELALTTPNFWRSFGDGDLDQRR